jgi:hypothetical protein
LGLISIILIVVGLCRFETISSIDNAIINEVLSTMQPKARRWFLVWGLLIAVFLVRGLLPWLIVWAAVPRLGPDATFSIDGVLGAFAFTLAVPLILLGNGLGAIVVRQLTIGNIERIKKYIYLKNGAMDSILLLGTIMLLDGFGFHFPSWVSPLSTFAVVGFCFFKSTRAIPVPVEENRA